MVDKAEQGDKSEKLDRPWDIPETGVPACWRTVHERALISEVGIAWTA